MYSFDWQQNNLAQRHLTFFKINLNSFPPKFSETITKLKKILDSVYATGKEAKVFFLKRLCNDEQQKHCGTSVLEGPGKT